MYFAGGEQPSEKSDPREVLRRGNEERKQRFEKAMQRGNELIEELDRLASEAERKGGDAKSFRTIEKALRDILKDATGEMRRAQEEGWALVDRAVKSGEIEDETGRKLYDLKAEARAVSIALGMRDAVLKKLEQAIREQSGEAGSEKQAIEDQVPKLKKETNKKLASLDAARDGLYDDADHREAQANVDKALEEQKRVKREMAKKDMAPLKKKKDDASKPFEKAKETFEAAQKVTGEKQKALDEAQKAEGPREEKRKEIEQLDTEIKTLESSVAEKKEAQKKLGDERKAAETDINQKNAAIDVQLAKDRAAVGPLGASPDPLKKAQVDAFDKKTETDKKKNEEEKTRKQREIDEKYAKLTEEIKPLEKQMNDKKAAKKKAEDALAAMPPVDLKKVTKEHDDAKAKEDEKKAEMEKLRGPAETAKKEYDDAIRPLTDAKKRVDDAKMKLKALNTKVNKRPVTADARRKYLDGTQMNAAIAQLRKEGSHLFRNFEEEQEDRILEIFKRQRELLVERAKGWEELGDTARQATAIEDLLKAVDGETRFLERHHSTDARRNRELRDLNERYSVKLAKVYETLTDVQKNSPEKLPMLEKEIKYREERGEAAKTTRMGNLNAAREGILREMYQKYQAKTTSNWKGDKFDSYETQQLKNLFAALKAEHGFLRGHEYMEDRQRELEGYGRGIRVVLEQRRLGGLEAASENAVKKAANVDERMGSLGTLMEEMKNYPKGGARREKIRDKAHAQREEIARSVDTRIEKALESTADSQSIHAAIEEATREIAMLNRYFTGTNVAGERVWAIQSQLIALRQKLASVNDQAIARSLAASASPEEIKSAYRCLRDEILLLRENEHYRNVPDAQGRIRDLDQFLTRLTQRVDDEIVSIHRDRTDSQAVERGLQLIEVAKDFRTGMERKLTGATQPNTYWLSELARMKADLKNARGPVAEAEKGKEAITMANLQVLKAQLSAIEAEKNPAKARAHLPWLEEVEQIFKSALDQHPVLVSPFLERVQEQLRRVRTFDESRDALTRDLIALTGKVQQQTKLMSEMVERLQKTNGVPLVKKRTLLERQVVLAHLLMANAQRSIEYAHDPGWNGQIDAGGIEGATKELEAQIQFAVNVLNGLDGGKKPLSSPKKPGGFSVDHSKDRLI